MAKLEPMSVCKLCGAWKPAQRPCERCSEVGDAPLPLPGLTARTLAHRVNGRPQVRITSRDWRAAGEPHYMIRVSQPWPPEVDAIEGMDEVAVAGVDFRRQAVGRFIAATFRLLVLEREPGNEHDPNAIKVHGLWGKRGGGTTNAQLGYVPRDVAAQLAGSLDGYHLHARPVLLFTADPEQDYSAGIRMELGASATLDMLHADVTLG